ncbi:MAG: response regulator [Planctomycetes bacterium]|nr:response regulator [Planctomycetota bacterium]
MAERGGTKQSKTQELERIRPVRDALIAAGVVLGCALTAILALRGRAAHALHEQVREDLLGRALLIAASVDGERHKLLQRPGDEATPQFRELMAPLARFYAARGSLKYLYTCALFGERVHFLLDPTPDGDADGDGRNDRAQVMEEYTGATPLLHATLRDGRPRVEDEPYTDAWGTFLTAYAPFFDRNGAVAGAVGADMDVGTWRVRMARIDTATWTALLVACGVALLVGVGTWRFRCGARAGMARLAVTLEELEAACAQAQAASQVKSQILANVSHEIRTPLNAVIGSADLLLESQLDPGQRDLVGTAHASATTLLGLLNDLLDLARFEAGHLDLQASECVPAELVEEVLDMLADQAQAKELALYAELVPEAWQVRSADAKRLRQVLTNLVGNAIKFTDHGGVRVEVQAGADHGGLRFAVHDSGPGIASGDLPRLFQAFEQLDPSATRRHGGTGLGLAISKTLVEGMGGRIDVASTPGQGSTFTFTLPLPLVAERPAPPPLTLDLVVVDHLGRRGEALAAQLRAAGCAVTTHPSAVPEGMHPAAAILVADAVDARLDADARTARTGLRAEGRLVVLVPRASQNEARSLLAGVADAVLGMPARRARLLAALDPLRHATLAAPRALAAIDQGLRVLLVEDNPLNLKLARAMLSRLGCDVATATNGQEALAALERGRGFDLVLMDCVMPVCDGYEATRALRRRESGGVHLPVVALTAHAQAGERERCLAAGMDDVLTKPFRADALAGILRRHCAPGPRTGR